MFFGNVCICKNLFSKDMCNCPASPREQEEQPFLCAAFPVIRSPFCFLSPDTHLITPVFNITEVGREMWGMNEKSELYLYLKSHFFDDCVPCFFFAIACMARTWQMRGGRESCCISNSACQCSWKLALRTSTYSHILLVLSKHLFGQGSKGKERSFSVSY